MKVCPECLEETLHKVYQPVGIVFKGKGFYATDHRSASGTSTISEKKSSQSKSETSASTETKSSTAKADTKEK